MTSEFLVEPHDHVVNLYDTDDDLVVAVTLFLAQGLSAGESAVIAANTARVTALDEGLRAAGVDTDARRSDGTLVYLDAADTLAQLMVGNAPDRDRFQAVAGGVIARLAAHGRGVRAFGEMVALLWEDGNVSGAIDLEAMWNELARDHAFSLYCAYSMASLASADDLDAMRHVCDLHSQVVAPKSYESGRVATHTHAGDVASEIFVPVPVAIRAVRRFVADTLAAWNESNITSDATIVVSELATNALVHAGCPFRVTVRLGASTIRISVEDLSASPPQRVEQVANAVGGRGMELVDRLCASWGTDLESHGKIVWAEIPRAATRTTTAD